MCRDSRVRNLFRRDLAISVYRCYIGFATRSLDRKEWCRPFSRHHDKAKAREPTFELDWKKVSSAPHYQRGDQHGQRRWRQTLVRKHVEPTAKRPCPIDI